MKSLSICCLFLMPSFVVPMVRRPPCRPHRLESRSIYTRPAILSLSRAQVDAFNHVRAQDLKDKNLRRLMYAAVKISILENSHLYDNCSARFKDSNFNDSGSYSANVLHHACDKLLQRVKNLDGIVDLALVDRQFDAEFTYALPKRIECGNLPDSRTALATAATLYGVLKYFDEAMGETIIQMPGSRACNALTDYVWQKKFAGSSFKELERLQKLFTYKM